MTTLTPNHIATLRTIADQTRSELGYGLHAPLQVHVLEKAGHIERNPSVNENGKFAFRATDSGFAELASVEPSVDSPVVQSAQTETPAATATRVRASRASLGVISLDDDVPMPERTTARTVGANEVYPFSTMGVGKSFFLPNSAERPDALKSISSAVAAATKRHAPKVFVALAVEEGGVKGARVWRKPDLTDEELAAVSSKRAERASNKVAKPGAVAPGVEVSAPATGAAWNAPAGE